MKFILLLLTLWLSISCQASNESSKAYGDHIRTAPEFGGKKWDVLQLKYIQEEYTDVSLEEFRAVQETILDNDFWTGAGTSGEDDPDGDGIIEHLTFHVTFALKDPQRETEFNELMKNLSTLTVNGQYITVKDPLGYQIEITLYAEESNGLEGGYLMKDYPVQSFSNLRKTIDQELINLMNTTPAELRAWCEKNFSPEEVVKFFEEEIPRSDYIRSAAYIDLSGDPYHVSFVDNWGSRSDLNSN